MSALGTPVEVGKIDGALRELWDTNEAATKASLINFAIYSQAEGALDANSDLIAQITAEHACRAILIAAYPGDGAPEVNAWITAHCHLGDGGEKSVCSEQIAFRVEDASAATIRNIVFAHLESDLPLVLWWQGEFTPVFDDRLYPLVDRLVIDSSCWNTPREQIETLTAAHANPASRFVLYDLNWFRLLNLRLTITGLFDDAAAAVALPDLERLTVSHGSDGHLTALFLIAWVNDRLGRTLPHTLEQVDTRHHIGCATFTTGAGGTLSVCNSERQDTLLKATIDLPGHRAEHLHPAAPDTLPALISQQLQSGSANRTYFRLLGSIADLLAD